MVGHRVTAQAETRERALEPLDDGGWVAAHGVKGGRNPQDAVLQIAGAREIARRRRAMEFGVKPGKDIRAAIDAAVATGKHRVGQQFLGANQHRPVGAGLRQAGEVFEIHHAARTVLDANHARMVHRAPDGFRFDGDLGERGEVVEKQRQRQISDEMIEIFLQLRLAERQI